MDTIYENNQAVVAGKVISEFQFSHEVFGEGFYLTELMVDRLSQTEDIVPLMVSDRLIDIKKSMIGEKIEVKGQFRSYNKHENNHNHLILSLFAREINIIDDDTEYSKPNSIYLKGFICKKPVYRTTPLGREIADLLVAVNRSYGKSDYIPCICWGRNARFAGNLEVGTKIAIWGRIQSRHYQKKIDDNTVINRTAYEVSINKIEEQE